MKQKFLNNELWTLTVGAAFQRAYLYKKNASEKEKKAFKNEIRNHIKKEILPNYKQGVVSDSQHIEFIENLSNFTTRFTILQNDKMNFGVSQKMLNLYLKYQWCLGDINKPPHFPVDRIIQEELNKVAKENGIETREIEAWTQFKDAKKYNAIIEFTRELKQNVDRFNNLSLAEIELELFERRNKK